MLISDLIAKDDEIQALKETLENVSKSGEGRFKEQKMVEISRKNRAL
jgi:hypothetical protein